MDVVCHFEDSKIAYRRFSLVVRTDFQQPPFYQEYFRKWGLDEPEGAK